MKKLILLLLILTSLLYAGFFRHTGDIEFRGIDCRIMQKEIVGYDITYYIDRDEPYEVYYLEVNNPWGCTSILIKEELCHTLNVKEEL